MPAKKKKSSKPALKSTPDLHMLPSVLNKMEKRLSFMETLSPAVLVTREVKDRKTEEHPRLMQLRGRGYKSYGHTQMNPFKTRVTETITQTSSANTALAGSTPLGPFATDDGIILATVFDEARCVNIHVYALAGCKNTASGAPSGSLAVTTGVLCLDPANSTAFNSTRAAMDADCKIGPIGFDGTNKLQPTPVAGVSFHLTMKVPPTVIGASSTVVGSNWTSAAETGQIVAWLKSYATTAGSGISTFVIAEVVYDMEYAYRN